MRCHIGPGLRELHLRASDPIDVVSRFWRGIFFARNLSTRMRQLRLEYWTSFRTVRTRSGTMHITSVRTNHPARGSTSRRGLAVTTRACLASHGLSGSQNGDGPVLDSGGLGLESSQVISGVQNTP